MKCLPLVAAVLLVAAANASASSPGDPFAGVIGLPLGEEEAAGLDGGDVTMTLNRQRTRLKVEVDYETDSPSGRSKVSYSYEIAAHNRIAKTNDADFMPAGGCGTAESRDGGKLTSRPEAFPEGTWNVTGVRARKDKFGPNIISTDAVGTVEVFDAKKNSLGRYSDTGYAIHSNTNDFSVSKSWGCIIIREADNKRLAGEIESDRARNGKQTLKVVSDREPPERRSSSCRSRYREY